MIDALVRFVVAASFLLSGNTRALPDSFARAIATHAFYSPFTQTPDGPKVTAATLVAIAWAEGQNRPDVVGDHGASFCALQIYLPNGARTSEGWTGPELARDVDKCVTAGLRILRYSIEHGPASCPICLYARGHVTPEARALSDHRMALTRRALSIELEKTP